MPVLSGAIVLVFGALTLWLHDETFIKLKPTIINTMFGVILLGGLAFGKSFLGYVFDSAFRLDAEGWRKLTFRWGLFFLFMALLNEFMWRNFSTDTWVAFKVWGNMPLSILFMAAQMPLMMRHALPEEGEEEQKRRSIAVDACVEPYAMNARRRRSMSVCATAGCARRRLVPPSTPASCSGSTISR